MNIAIYIIVGIISFGISYIIAGLVDKFTKEDDKIQDFIKQFDENDEYLESNEFKEEFKKVKKSSKVKFKPKFNLVIAIATVICMVPLFIFREDYLSFFVKAYLMVLLIIAMFADMKACIIPDEVNIIGLITGVMYVIYNFFVSTKQGIELVLGGISGFTIFFFIGLLGYLIFKKEGMGGGDIKLMGVIGLFMGFKSIIQIFILSFFVAAIISALLLLTKIKKKDDYIPFGPFIVIATYITMFVSGAYTYNQIYRYYIYK